MCTGKKLFKFSSDSSELATADRVSAMGGGHALDGPSKVRSLGAMSCEEMLAVSLKVCLAERPKKTMSGSMDHRGGWWCWYVPKERNVVKSNAQG